MTSINGLSTLAVPMQLLSVITIKAAYQFKHDNPFESCNAPVHCCTYYQKKLMPPINLLQPTLLCVVDQVKL